MEENERVGYVTGYIWSRRTVRFGGGFFFLGKFETLRNLRDWVDKKEW
jgi:hypothetical protein